MRESHHIEELRQTLENEERVLGHCIFGCVVQSRLTKDGNPPVLGDGETVPLPALRPNEAVMLVDALRKHAAAPGQPNGALGHVSKALLFSLLAMIADEEGDRSCFLDNGGGKTFQAATQAPWEVRRLLGAGSAAGRRGKNHPPVSKPSSPPPTLRARQCPPA